MPIFYFHILCDGVMVTDDEGSQHDSHSAAVMEAVKGARCLMSAEVQAGHLRLDQSIELADAEGRHLTSVQFEEALRITGKAQSRLPLVANDC